MFQQLLESIRKLRGMPRILDEYVDIREAQVVHLLPDEFEKGKPQYPAGDYDHILKLLREHLPRNIKRPVISEFGGGTGNFAVLLPHLISGARPIIFDNDPSSCAVARARGLSVVQGDLHTLNFRKPALRGKAHAVIGNAFEFTENYALNYAKIAGQLYLHSKPGALLVFQFFSGNAAKQFRGALEQNRFRIVKEHFGKGNPLIAAVRLPSRKRREI